VQPERPELAGNVVGGEPLTARARAAALERIVREDAGMGAQGERVDLLGAGRGGGDCGDRQGDQRDRARYRMRWRNRALA